MLEDDRNTRYVEVLEAYGKLHRYCELMWHHSEFLLLGYGAYATFVDFCKNALPDIPTSIAQMVAGIDVLLFRPDAELKRLARLAIDTGIDSAFVQGRSQQEIDDELAQSDAEGMARGAEKVKDPWFNMATGDGLYHYYGSWLDDPSIPYASLIGYVSALTNGDEIERPTEELAERRTDSPSTAHCSTRRRARRRRAARALAHGLPVRRGAQVPLRLLVPHALVEQGARVRASSPSTGTWRTRRTSSSSPAPRSSRPSTARPRVGDGRRAARPEALAADRRASQGDARAARRLDAPPAIEAMPEEVNDPVLNMLWGITTERARMGAEPGRRSGAERRGRVAGRRRGNRARREDGAGDLGRARRGDPRLQHHFASVGADLHEGQGGRHGHRGVMSHAAIVCREYGIPAVVGTGRATSQIKTGQTIRVDGSSGVVTILD